MRIAEKIMEIVHKKKKKLGEPVCNGSHQWLYQDQMSEAKQIKYFIAKNWEI